MRIHIEGNVSSYYVQTLCLVFYPGAKFTQQEQRDDAPGATVVAEELTWGARAAVTLEDGKRKVTEVAEQNNVEGYDMQRTIKMAVGKAFFAAGKKMHHYTPQWGILTGVRPGKLALDMMLRGMNRTEVKRMLRNEMFVYPKKAALVTEIAYREQTLLKKLDPAGCSIYISIPFCPTRCNYCSFVSFTSPKLLQLIPAYLDRLCEDITKTFEIIRALGKKVFTVYIGGGTPTTLNEQQLARLLSHINQYLDFDTLTEFTLEAGRPDTITAEKLNIAASFGVTRVSINPQTLNDQVLRQIGRCHTSKEFFDAYELARKSGISHINTDLIAGLPDDTFISFSKTVDGILSLSPDNLTIHTFCVKKAADILKEGENVYSRSGGDVGKSLDYAYVCAKNRGYFPYYIYRQKNTVGNFENVGFSREGAEGYYNILMMEELHSVFACGAGAVTKLVSRDRKHIQRIFAPKYPYEYLDRSRKSTVDDHAFAQMQTFYQTYDPTL